MDLRTWLLLALLVAGQVSAQAERVRGRRLLATCRTLVQADVPGRRSWLLGRLRALGLEPRIEEFVRRGVRGANLVARVGVKKQPPLVLVAHLDGLRTSPGANDMASGCAVLLEMAAWLRSGGQKTVPAVLLFVDASKPRHLGSQAWLERHDGLRCLGVIDLGLVGRGDTVILGVTSPFGDHRLVQLGAAGARAAGIPCELMARMPVSEGRTLAASGLDVATLGMLPAGEVGETRAWLKRRGRGGPPPATLARVSGTGDGLASLQAAALERACSAVEQMFARSVAAPPGARRIRKDLVRDLRRFRHLLAQESRWKALRPEDRARMLDALGPRAALRCLLQELQRHAERTLPAASLILHHHVSNRELRQALEKPLAGGSAEGIHAALLKLYREHHAHLVWNAETASIGLDEPAPRRHRHP